MPDTPVPWLLPRPSPQDAAIAAIVSREHLRGQKLAKAVGALKLSGTGSEARGGGPRIDLLVRGLQPAIQARIGRGRDGAGPATLARAVMATGEVPASWPCVARCMLHAT